MFSRLLAQLDVVADEVLQSDTALRLSRNWRYLMPVLEVAGEVKKQVSSRVSGLWQERLVNIEQFLEASLTDLTTNPGLIYLFHSHGYLKFSDIVEIRNGIRSPFLALKPQVLEALGPELTEQLWAALLAKGINYVCFS